VGEELGLPEEIVQRQPFPGPGLAVRIVGEVTRERVEKVRAADSIVRDEIRRAGLERDTWQAFCVVLGDVRHGRGDGGRAGPTRTPSWSRRDIRGAMTADWARLPHDVPRPDRAAHRARGAGDQSGGVRHHLKTPGHDRMGVGAGDGAGDAFQT
jgi:GMP synthase PP-ATPase subunit